MTTVSPIQISENLYLLLYPEYQRACFLQIYLTMAGISRLAELNLSSPLSAPTIKYYFRKGEEYILFDYRIGHHTTPKGTIDLMRNINL